MASGDQVAAAPVDIVIGGKTYRMSPLQDRDVAELDNWLRSRIIRMARDSLAADEPEDMKRITMEAAIRFAQGLTWISGEGAQVMDTIDGISRIVWQGVYHNHPEVSYEEVRRSMFQEKDNQHQSLEVKHFIDAFGMLNLSAEDRLKKKKTVRKSRQQRQQLAGKKFIDHLANGTGGRRNKSQS